MSQNMFNHCIFGLCIYVFMILFSFGKVSVFGFNSLIPTSGLNQDTDMNLEALNRYRQQHCVTILITLSEQAEAGFCFKATVMFFYADMCLGNCMCTTGHSPKSNKS